MNKTILILTLAIFSLFPLITIAATKVVVIPLNSSTCPQPLSSCNNNCVDTNFNPNYCGDCSTQCTPGQYCENGNCVNKSIVNCDDGNICTDDYYDAQTGVCLHTNNTNPCNDSNGCTQNDACSAGFCQGVYVNCSDGLTCTTDTCSSTGDFTYTCSHIISPDYCKIDNVCYPDGQINSANGCEICAPQTNQEAWSNNPIVCDDGVPCTKNDFCSAGTCVGTPYPCSDGLACTVDICDGYGGCTYVENPPGGCE